MLQATFSKIHEAKSPSPSYIGGTENTLKKALHCVSIPTQTATFGMACFWAPDALYGTTVGVIRTRVGYSGGTKEDPTYRNLGDHTEVIKLDFDPNMIDYETLLRLFWENHDATATAKTQYASMIFYHDEKQKEIAERSLAEQKKISTKPILTLIRPAVRFYDAEDYHQKYRLQQHPSLCECLGIHKGGELLKSSYVAARLNGYVIGCGGVAQYEQELPILGLDEGVGDYVRKLVTKFEGQGLIC